MIDTQEVHQLGDEYTTELINEAVRRFTKSVPISAGFEALKTAAHSTADRMANSEEFINNCAFIAQKIGMPVAVMAGCQTMGFVIGVIAAEMAHKKPDTERMD